MLKRSNEQWVSDLKDSSLQRDNALTDLHTIIQRGLPYALSPYLPASDPRFSSLIEDITQETLLRVLDKLDTFEGRSQFTTWVQKIAVHLAFTELRRKRWENISLDSLLDNPDTPPPLFLSADSGPGPEPEIEAADLIGQVEEIINQELTPKQRQAIEALVFHGMPLEEIARQMGSNRNALYKLLHDARLRIKKRMAERGLTPQDVLATLESR